MGLISTSANADEAALWAIQAEWSSSHDFATRVANLTSTGGGLLDRLNGDYFLLVSGADQTVFDDENRDALTGAAGADWFFAGEADAVAGLTDRDRAFLLY